MLLILVSCVANIFKSGSTIVIVNPIIKTDINIKDMFLFLIILFPIFSPIIIIDILDPKVKVVIPNINKNELIIKDIIVL